MTYRHISQADLVAKMVDDFAWNCRVCFGRKETVLAIGGSYMLPESLSIILYISKEGYEILKQQWMSVITK